MTILASILTEIIDIKENDSYNTTISSLLNMQLNYEDKESPANALNKITNYNFSTKQLNFVPSSLNNDLINAV